MWRSRLSLRPQLLSPKLQNEFRLHFVLGIWIRIFEKVKFLLVFVHYNP
jgi:hypothetical protein